MNSLFFRSSAFLFALFLINPAFSAEKLRNIRLALNWVPEPEFGGFYQAQLDGLYGKTGMKIELIPAGSSTPTVQLLQASRVESAIMSAAEFLRARENGSDLVAVYNVYETSPMGIMAHKSRNLKSMADVFESGTLAIEKGQAFFTFLKGKYGFQGVKLVPYSGGVANFLHDKNFAQQCFVTAEPLMAKAAGVEPQVFLLADVGYNPYIEIVVFQRAFFEAHREEVTAFVRATREGWKRYLQDPSAANKYMAKLNKTMSYETFQEGAKAQEKLVTSKIENLGLMTETHWKTIGQQLTELKLLRNAPSRYDFFVNLK